MAPHWSSYIIIRMSEGNRILRKEHSITVTKIALSLANWVLQQTSHFSPNLTLTSGYVFLVGLGGMYTQTESRLSVMKIQMPAAAWLEKLHHHPNISRRGNGNHLLFLMHISTEESSPCCFSEMVSLLGSMLFPNSVTFCVHQNPASAKCELNSLSEGGNKKSDDSICSISKAQHDSQCSLFRLKVPTAEKSRNLDPHWLYSSAW